jgi:peptidylprolyl isomerase
MKTLIKWVTGALIAMTATAASGQPTELDPENTIYLDLEYGRVVIQLRPDLAPGHVQRFKELARAGFYDGLVWHRVIEGFMAQTGDPAGDGTGGSDLPNLLARASDINSANSQFYVVLDHAPHLNGQYTYFGQVVEGMEFIDQIRKGNPARNGTVTYPDRIVQMQVAADVD